MDVGRDLEQPWSKARLGAKGLSGQGDFIADPAGQLRLTLTFSWSRPPSLLCCVRGGAVWHKKPATR
jgi:hypothetical protein